MPVLRCGAEFINSFQLGFKHLSFGVEVLVVRIGFWRSHYEVIDDGLVLVVRLSEQAASPLDELPWIRGTREDEPAFEGW
jgi:hypothetical protein